MYNKKKAQKTTLKRNKSYQGESLEKKINRILNNKEPIKDGAPLIYTERKNGVNPDHNIRTDRFEAAIDAMDYVSKSKIAKRDARIGEQAKKGMEAEKQTEIKKDSGAEPTQATEK